MKTTTIYWIVGIIAVLAIGYFTNWFGMGKKKTTTAASTGTGNGTGNVNTTSSRTIGSNIILSERTNCVSSGTRTCCRPGGPAPTIAECNAL